MLPDAHFDSLKQGFVFKKLQGAYFVRCAGQIVRCAISNKLRKQLIYPLAAPTSLRRRVQEVQDIGVIDPVAIGDQVRFMEGGESGADQLCGLITEVLPRRNQLARKAAAPMAQVIVANVDQVVAVCPAGQPAQRRWVLDQYLAAAEAAGLPALICLTKLDLAAKDLLAAELTTYLPLGYAVFPTSAVMGEGLAALRAALAGRVAVLLGKSGVGKTSLLNAIQPGLGLRVSAVNQHTAEGRHTTSYLQMFELDGGGSVVDTPGQREFNLWDTDGVETAQLFPEMRPYLGRCKFGADCTHDHEPGCAIKVGLAEGRIAASRYQSYLRLRAS